jgi:hypothetical protein
MPSPAEDLARLITTHDAFDRSRRYVHFDRLWHSHDALDDASDCVYRYLTDLAGQLPESVLGDRGRLVLLSPDTARSSLGIIPVSVLVASRMGCRFAVWKEIADIRWASPALLGSTDAGLVCFVLQDVVSSGRTAVRIAKSIKQLGWSFPLYVAAVYNNTDEDTGPEAVLQNIEPVLGHVPAFKYILSAREL